MSARMKGIESGHVLFTTSFDYAGINSCKAVAILKSDYGTFRETSRFLRDPEDGLGLNAFDLVVTDRFAKYYLRGDKKKKDILKISCEHHLAELAVLIHNAELILPSRFRNREEEEEFHKERMLAFSKVSMQNHPGIRVLPVYIRFVNDGKTLEYVSYEDLLYGGKERVVWRANFSFRNVLSCKYLLSVCLDWRYRKESFDFVYSSLKIPFYHLIGEPGSCKGIISGDKDTTITIENAIRAGAEEGVVINHYDCLAYEEETNGMSFAEQHRFHKGQLQTSKAILKKMGLKDVFLAYANKTPGNFIEFIVVK